MKLVITVVGKDHVGIIAGVSKILADNQVNILSINQNIMNGFFNMVLIGEALDEEAGLHKLQKVLAAEGEVLHVEIKIQHEDIFNCMHQI